MQMSISFDAALPERMARRTDPGTSHAAAAQARELAQHHQDIILQCLLACGPLGKDGIGARTKLTGVAVCRRLPELAKAGLIVATGRTVQSTAGRAEREWRAA